MDEAAFCPHCGCAVESAPATIVVREAQNPVPKKQNDTLDTVIKIFMIIGCVSIGWAIIPLAWCIPMTVSVFNKLKSGEPITTGFKVCVLLFVNIVAGICLLVRDE